MKDLDACYLLYNRPFADAFQLWDRGKEGMTGREVLLGRDDRWLDPSLQPGWRAHDVHAATAPLYVEEFSQHPDRGR